MNEKQIQAAVVDHWRRFGLPNTLVCAVPNAGAFGQPGLHRGVFDLLVIGSGKAQFIELKTIRGRVSEHQRVFQAICVANGISAAITYGRDEPIRVLEVWNIVKPQVARAAA